MRKSKTPELSSEMVESVISLNPQPISRHALAELFGLSKKQKDHQLSPILEDLQKDGRIKITLKGDRKSVV